MKIKIVSLSFWTTISTSDLSIEWRALCEITEPQTVWDEVCSRWVFMFSWNIRLLKTSQAQLSHTWEKKSKVTLAVRIKLYKPHPWFGVPQEEGFVFVPSEEQGQKLIMKDEMYLSLISCFQGNQGERWQWAEERENDRRSDKVGAYHSPRPERWLASVISIYWCFTEIQTVTAPQDRWIF